MRNLVMVRKLGGLVALVVCACGGEAAEAHRVGSAVVEVKAGPGDPAHNLIKQSKFDAPSMLPWMTSFTIPAAGEGLVKNGAMCIHIDNGGVNRWDAQVRHREMTIQNGHTYNVSFKAWASRPTSITGKVGMSISPY